MKEIYENVSKCITDMNLLLDKLVGLVTDVAPVMCGEKNGLVGRMWLQMQQENCSDKLIAYHCFIHQETL